MADNVVRRDIIQIEWDVGNSPLGKLTKEANQFQKTVTKAVGGGEDKMNDFAKSVNKSVKEMTTGTKVAKKFSTNVKDIAKTSVQKLQTGLQTVKTKLTEGVTKLKTFYTNLKKIDTTSLKKLSASLDTVTKKLTSGVVAGAKMAATAITALASASVAGAVVGVKYNAEMEQYKTSFEVMTGSADKATRVVDKLQKMGAATPFEMTDLANTTQLLMNYGLTADDSISKMSMLGDISQGSADKMTRIATAYGQMSSAGKVSLEDIKQMIEAGYNPLQEISKTTGESMASLYDRISKGTISVDEITASMKRSTSAGGKYFQSMQKQSKTFNGQLSTMKDNFNMLLGNLTKGISEKLAGTVMPKINDLMSSLSDAFSKGGLDGLLAELGPVGSVVQDLVNKFRALTSNNEKMARIKEVFNSIKTAVSSVIKFVGTLAGKFMDFATKTSTLNTVKTLVDGVSKVFQFLSQHIDTVVAVVKNFGVAFIAAVVAVKAITFALTAYNTIMGVVKTVQAIAAAAQMGFNAALLACPLTWIVLAIAAVIAIIAVLVLNWDKVKAAAVTCWEWIKSAWSTAATWLNTNVIQPIVSFFKGLWEGIKSIFSVVGAWLMSNIVTPVMTFVQNLVYFVIGIFTYCKEWVCAVWSVVAGWVNANVIQPIVTFFTNLWNRITEIVQLVWNTICIVWGVVASWVNSNIIQPVVSFFTNLWTKITTIVNNVWNSICSIWGQISDWVNSNIIEPIKNFFGDLWDSITGGVKTATDTISDVFSTAYDTVVGIWEGITGFFNGLWDGIKNVVNKIIGKGKEATGAAGKAKSGGATKHAMGGLVTKAHLGIVGEAGPEMIIPLSQNKRNRGLSLWQQAGQMLGATPSIVPSISMPAYTPQETISNTTSSRTETNTYSPQFTLNFSGNTDRTAERTVKQWVKDALNETFASMERANPRIQEV